MITCKPKSLAHEVCLGSLKVGDTFLYDYDPCMIVDRNGHSFPIKLSTGKCLNLTPQAKVSPIKCELFFDFIPSGVDKSSPW